ncbi:hypothetical protein BC826DRAFT_1013477 [Russula brevipes]|nr:hypothetical protein BC826DRAFT_1013477 [Russula brevipes]
MAVADVDADAHDRRAIWRSVRPWHPRVSLSVTEITSVSATFVGVSVKVNGSPWRKCLARLADDADEAMIIIYGLMPGRLYDIELGIIPGDEKLKGQIVTESTTGDRVESDSEGTLGIPPIGAFPPSASSSPAADRSPSPPSPSPPPTPSGGPSHSSQTFEDYLATLQLSLSHLQADHDALSNTLKSARRDSQKGQASQRAEIASLRRAAQKHSAGDTRMKQKVRALEEAVKQAIKCREDVEAEYAVLEDSRAEQEAELADASRRCEEARARAEEWRARREKAEEEAGSKLQGARAELAAVEARLEKLRVKRVRLEGRAGAEEVGEGGEDEEANGECPSRRGRDDEDVSDAHPGGLVGELEAKLREMLLERERIEADPYAQLPPPPHSRAAPQGYSPNHARNSSHPSHSHSHSHVHSAASARSKRPGGPPFSHHSHSHSHPPRALPPTTTTTMFSPPASAPAGRTVAHHVVPDHHPSRGPIARRKSSPPPHHHAPAEKSALSLNAPPFEPASIKGKHHSRAGGP